MLDEIRERLEEEAGALLHELNVELPKEIERAVALGDLRENSEYSAALERQRFVQARLDYLSRRLSELLELDREHIPVDRVGFGSKVLARHVATGEVEEYVLAFGDALDLDSSEISMRSPIGRALLGRRPGDVVQVSLPARSIRLEILELTTMHEIAGLSGDGADASEDGSGAAAGNGETGSEEERGAGASEEDG